MTPKSRRVVRFAGLVCLRRVLMFCAVMGLGGRAVAAPPKESSHAPVPRFADELFRRARYCLPRKPMWTRRERATMITKAWLTPWWRSKTCREDKAEPAFIIGWPRRVRKNPVDPPCLNWERWSAWRMTCPAPNPSARSSSTGGRMTRDSGTVPAPGPRCTARWV